MKFVIEEKKKRGTMVVEGALTINRVTELRDELLSALMSVEKVGLDMRAVTEIDLSVMQLICSAHKTAIKMGRSFELIDSSMEVAKNTAGLNGFLRQQGCSIEKNNTCIWRAKRK